MPPVTAENFQERVMAQRAAVEVQSQGTSSQCSTCAKRFSTANAFDNHIKSRRHQDAEKKASQATQKEVERLNEKNLEKGLDHDAMNAAIQQAIKAQQAGSPKSKPAQASGAASQNQPSSQEKKRPDKPPRLQWFEEQAKKLGKEHIEGEEEAAMEDVPEEEGAKIGHRSLMRYYKQRFGISRVVAVAGNRNAVGRVLRQYKALGWSSDMAKDASLSRQRDMQYVQRMKSKWMLKTGMSNNSTKQMHFRAQVRF
ncbi:Zinc finger protein 622 [Acipenser ruthenus]|uniref:Cytoplasmic 60S subunit biogenesis factor ZNF622 n=1 Tax=Acipenser ruthenus TaxID=7906 RepID=A0A444TY68_ACIRT|nr:Zinc finger protein 622 [Acipenser ruthenus]